MARMVPTRSAGPRARVGILLALAVLAGGRAHANEDAGALRAFVQAERQRAPAPPLERAAFLLRQPVREATLSPDGRQVAYLRETARQVGVHLLTADGKDRQLLAKQDVQGLAWTTDGRWLLLQSPRQLFAVAVGGQTGSGLVSALGGNGNRELLSVDASQPAAVIVRERVRALPGQPSRWRLLRIDMQGGTQAIHADAAQPTGVAFDGQGRLRFLMRIDGSDEVILHVGPEGDTREIARCVQLQRCRFGSTRAYADRLWLQSDLGSDLAGVLQLKANGTRRWLHRDPAGIADVAGVATDPATGQPLLASYRSGVAAEYAIDASLQPHLDRLHRAFPGQWLDLQVGHGPAARWLVRTGSASRQQDEYFLYRPDSGDTTRILDLPALARTGKPAPWIQPAALARKLAFDYRASDGRLLHGYLLLPPGQDVAKLPLVAKVHGGPWNADRPEYGNYAQFLANRGYAVFEPNFRGSTGYGRDYLRAAGGDFGNGRVQQDIVEGVSYLLAQGIGDPARVGIVGASFGGYAALQGLTWSPGLFKAGVAIVPPTDFARNLRHVAQTAEANRISPYLPFEDWLRALSLDLHDEDGMARLSRASPLRNSQRMSRPLLLIAGGEDQRVPIGAVIEYAARLKQQGKPVSLLVDPRAGHANDSALGREAMLYLSEALLQQALGGAVPVPPDAPLQDYLRRNLRVPGTLGPR